VALLPRSTEIQPHVARIRPSPLTYNTARVSWAGGLRGGGSMRDRLRSRSRSRRTCLVGGGHVCVHASCIDGQRLAYMHIGFQAKYSLSCPTSPI